jgi:hypothetical protein
MTTLTSVPTPGDPAFPLNRHHPVASAARRTCRTAHRLHYSARLDGVACPPCWATALLCDAAIAEAFELPSAPPAPDPLYVDPVAVERACTGERIPLTWIEQVAATRLLLADGWGVTWIRRWLHVGDDTARELIGVAEAFGHLIDSAVLVSVEGEAAA